jgi:VWFA-related protein
MRIDSAYNDSVPLAAILIFCAVLLDPQQEVVIRSHPYIPPPTSPLTAETNLVETSLVIRDARGTPVGGFHASEFQIFDNGKAQQILSFTESKLPEPGEPATPGANASHAKSPPTPAPPGKTVTLFFDDLHTDSPELMRTVGAARKFVATALQPTDRVAIATSSSSADLDFTNDGASVQATLDQIRTHVRTPLASCPALTPVDAYLLIKNVDVDVKSQAIQQAQSCICGPSADPACLTSRATTLAAPGVALSAAETVWGQAEVQSSVAVGALGEAVRRLAAVNGIRVMVLISSGFLPPLTGSSMDAVVNAALRWNITVHSLDAKSLDAEREGINGSGYSNTHVDRTQLTRQTALWAPLEKIAKGTGGHFFHNTNDLAGALQMAAAPTVSYQLSFNPGGRDGQFHDLKIAFKNKVFYSLQFRPGYFSPGDPKKEPLNRASLDAAVFSKQTLRDIPASVALAAGQVSDGTIPISVAVTVDVNRLQFATSDGRHVQQIVFLTTLLDANNSFVIGKESIMDLALTDEKLALLQKDGLRAVATLSAPAGIYQVRTIIREAMKGNLAASTIPIDLRPN